MAERKRYALVGAGSRSTMFTRALLEDFREHGELVALCDSNQTRREAHNADFQKEFGVEVPTYQAEQFEQMLREKQVDAVIVTILSHVHANSAEMKAARCARSALRIWHRKCGWMRMHLEIDQFHPRSKGSTRLLPMLALATILPGCGDPEPEPPETEAAPEATAHDRDTGAEGADADGSAAKSAADDGEMPASVAAEQSGDGPVTMEDGVWVVKISGNDRMQYNINSFKVPAGSTVRIEFENLGDLPRESMGHSVTLLKPNADATSFLRAATAAGLDNSYLPQDEMDHVLATTKLLGPGETDTVEFEAPEPGEYPYVCVFPGHATAGMRGSMIVSE